MGVNYNTGNGGPASFSFSDVEMYGSDTSLPRGRKEDSYVKQVDP